MPTYQYACTECGHAFEQFQSFSDDALTECPECQGRLRKVFNAVGVVFKGSGFYRTDSREKTVVSVVLVLRHQDRDQDRDQVRDQVGREDRDQVRDEGRRHRLIPRCAWRLWRDCAASPAPTYGRRVPTREQLKQDLTRRRRAVRRVVLARRRPLAALLAAAAVVAGVHELRPPPPAVEAVLTAARDLPAGATLGRDDLATVDYAAGTAPVGLADDAVGRVLAAPVRAGEPLTDVRLVGAPLAAAYPGSVTVPVRLPDAGMAALLRVGDRIDLVAADPQGSVARVVATDLAVVALPEPDDEATSSGLPGRLVLLAAPEAVREELAQAAVTGFLTFTYSR